MGFIRRGLFVIVSLALLFALIAGSFFWTLSQSLNYEVLAPQLKEVAKDVTNNQMNLKNDISIKYSQMSSHCMNNSEYRFYNDNLKHEFVFSCSLVLNGTDAVFDNAIDELVKDIYFREYDCDFWDCALKTGSPFFLISQKAKNYWNEKFMIALAISILLVVLLFFLINNKMNLPIYLGSVLILSSLLFRFLEIFLLKIAMIPLFGMIPQGLESVISNFDFLFVKSYLVMWVGFSLGIFLIALGISFKIWNYFYGKETEGKSIVKNKK